jgi:hypothetical protein
MEVQDEEHRDDEILSPLKKNKRSSDAWPEDALSPTSYREPKRAKLEPLPALNLLAMVGSRNLTSQSSKRLTKPFVRAATEPACQKLTPRPVIMNGKATMAFVFSQRARSVPLPTDPFPELDLRTLSPTRSPSKVTSQLRITPVPQLTEAAPTSPLTPPASTDGEVPASEDGMDVDTASAMSHSTNIPLIDPTLPDPTNPIINIEFATPRNQAGPPQTPLSPLTPLTPTSFVGRLPAVQSLLATDANVRSILDTKSHMHLTLQSNRRKPTNLRVQSQILRYCQTTLQDLRHLQLLPLASRVYPHPPSRSLPRPFQ